MHSVQIKGGALISRIPLHVCTFFYVQIIIHMHNGLISGGILLGFHCIPYLPTSAVSDVGWVHEVEVARLRKLVVY